MHLQIVPILQRAGGKRPGSMRASLGLPLLLVCLLSAGCGTTRWSDTSRTATEQMLISDAVDRAVSDIDFSALAEHNVYLDTKFVTGYVDEKYLVSTMRQHMLASGCIVKDRPEDANYVVEVRAGAIGTNRQDLLFGVPQTNLPSGGGLPVPASTIPEIPLFKRTGQQGVCKLAVFAYDRQSGQPVWQSGIRQIASKTKDVWVLGAGPFQRGTIYEGTKFAGEGLHSPLSTGKTAPGKPNLVAQEMVFADPAKRDASEARPWGSGTPDVLPASFNAPVASAGSNPPALLNPPPNAAPIPQPPPQPATPLPPSVVSDSGPLRFGGSLTPAESATLQNMGNIRALFNRPANAPASK